MIMGIALRDYQQEASDSFFRKLHEGIKRQLIVLPTGGGKTVVAADISKRFYQNVMNGKPIVFIAHREELLQQTSKKMNLVWNGVQVGKVKGQANHQNAEIIVASTQTLVRGRKIVDPGLVIYDEAHHCGSKGSKSILTSLGCFDPDGPPLLGITATPNRADKIGLGDIFQEVVYEKSLIEMIVSGYLCDIKAKRVVAESLDLGSLKIVAGDFNQMELGEVMSQESAIQTVVDAYIEHAEGRKTIVFAASVKQTYQIAESLRSHGILAAGIDGSLNDEERRRILSSFERNEYRVIVNCMMLTEGFDEPSVSCIIMARPTKSESLYIQSVGRGTRLHPDKANCLILDIVGVTETNSLMTLSKLFPPIEKPETDSVTQTQLDLQDDESVISFQKRKEETHRVQGQMAYEVSLFTDKTIFSWVKASENSYYIGLGDKRACFLLKESTHEWWALFEHSDNKLYPLYHEPLDLEYAQGVAETFLKSLQRNLFLKEAFWRRNPMSEGQRKQLIKHSIPFDHTWSKGMASDALDLVFGKRIAENALRRFDPISYRMLLQNPDVREKTTLKIQLIQRELSRQTAQY